MDSIADVGDIVLVIGTEQKKLLVASTVLKKSSRVFAALLGPNYLEGQQSSSAQPKEITLPDDEAAAMSDMCHLLHNNQVKDLTLRPTADRLLAFAVVVDKYNCVDALQLQVQGLLLGLPIIRDNLSFDDYAKSLLAFYLLKHSWTFKELCGKVILRSAKPFTSILEAEWAKPFPLNLIYALEQKRSEVQQRIIFDLPVAGIRTCCKDRGANHTEMLSSTFRVHFWPPNAPLRGDYPLSKTIDLIRSIGDVHVPSGSHCHTLNIKSAIFTEFANGLNEDCTKLCLQCIMAGRIDFKDECEEEQH